MKEIKCKADGCTYFVNERGGVEYIETESGKRLYPYVWDEDINAWNQRCLSYGYLRKLDREERVLWN